MGIRNKAEEITPLKYKAIYHCTMEDMADDNEVRPLRDKADKSRLSLSSITDIDSYFDIADVFYGMKSFAIIDTVVRNTSLLLSDLYRDLSKQPISKRAKLS